MNSTHRQLGELHRALAAAVAGLDETWEERFIATRRLVIAEPPLLRYIEHYRADTKEQLAASLAARLALDPDDLRLHVLAELAITAFSMAGRAWVRSDGAGDAPLSWTAWPTRSAPSRRASAWPRALSLRARMGNVSSLAGKRAG
jgi:hypothetical protein